MLSYRKLNRQAILGDICRLRVFFVDRLLEYQYDFNGSGNDNLGLYIFRAVFTRDQTENAVKQNRLPLLKQVL